jgi:hypothetical protein
MKILVLATTSATSIERAVARLRARYPEAAVVIGTTEAEQAVFAQAGLPTWVMGEHNLQLDAPLVRSSAREQGFEHFVIPLGLPRQSLLFVARFVKSIGNNCFVVEAPLVRHLHQWPLVWLVLVVYSLLLGLPLIVAVRCGLVLDGFLLLAGQLLARTLHRLRRLWRPSPDSGSLGPVCHVITGLGTGGAQRQLIEYLPRSRLQDRLRLLVLFEDNAFFLSELQAIGIPAELLGIAGSSNRWLHETIGRAFPMSKALWVLWQRLRRLQPSCVYSWLFATNVIAATAARLAGVPLVISSVRNLSAWKTWPEYRRWWMRPADRLNLSVQEREDISSISMRRSAGAYTNDQWTPEHEALMRAAASDPRVARIFVFPGAKVAMCNSATGVRSWLWKIRPWWGHHYHFHVRLKCPAGNASCVDQAPPPPGDGCAEAAGWVDRILNPPPPDPNAPPPTPRAELTMANLPGQCSAVLNAN